MTNTLSVVNFGSQFREPSFKHLENEPPPFSGHSSSEMRFLPELVTVITVACVAMLAIPASAVISNDYFVQNTNSCFSTGLLPRAPAGLDFCLQHSYLSCCLPGFDSGTIISLYQSYVATGAGCGLSKHSVRAAYSQLRAWACLACDPLEPRYRFLSAVGDLHLGGTVSPSNKSGPTDFTWRVCKSFLYGSGNSQGLWGKNGSQYDTCGMQISSCVQAPLYNISNATFSSSGTCTSNTELIVPSVAFLDDSDPAATMLSMMSQSLNGFQFVVVDDMAPGFNWMNTPCFGSNGAGTLSTLLATAVVFAMMMYLTLI